MSKEDAQEAQIADDQLLEWGNTPLRSEDREAAVEPVEEPAEDEEVEEQEDTDTPDDVEEEDQEDEEEPEVDEYEAPATVDADDPGEYIPKDYSFTVEVDGKTHKITTPEQAAEFADENAEKMGARELVKFMRQANKMEDKLEKDKDEFDARKAKYEETKAAQEQQLSVINNVANEINYLVQKGQLPKVAAKYSKADWSDPEVAKQPGVKEQVELLNYMRKENDARSKAGLAPLTSALDAFNAMELDRRNNNEVDEAKQQAEARKRAGSRIAGTSPKPVNVAPKGVAVGRAFSLSDLDSL